MRKTLCTAALLLAISGSALAGDMGNPTAPQPPPPDQTGGVITTDAVTSDADSVTETLLSVLETALGSFLALN